MSALRAAERQVMDLVIALHFIAGEVADPVVAAHLRKVADLLNDAAMELRALWECAGDFAQTGANPALPAAGAGGAHL